MGGHHAGRHVAGQGHRRRLPDRRRAGHGGSGAKASAPRHAMARPSAATRWPAPPAMRCWTSCWRRASSMRSRARPNSLRAELDKLMREHPGIITEVRGQGLLLGLQLRRARTPSCRPPASPKACWRSPPATTCCVSCRRWLSPNADIDEAVAADAAAPPRAAAQCAHVRGEARAARSPIRRRGTAAAALPRSRDFDSATAAAECWMTPPLQIATGAGMPRSR